MKERLLIFLIPIAVILFLFTGILVIVLSPIVWFITGISKGDQYLSVIVLQNAVRERIKFWII